jgi:hypothetical protein
VRTTLTLDDDVAAKLRQETRRTGKSFKETVNECLRIGLNARQTMKPPRRFVVRAKNLGSLRPGISLDSISELLDQIEGPLHR